MFIDDFNNKQIAIKELKINKVNIFFVISLLAPFTFKPREAKSASPAQKRRQKKKGKSWSMIV
jgi:hypothetical protein